MATQKFLLITLLMSIGTLLGIYPEQANQMTHSGQLAIQSLDRIANGEHPLTPPGKPAPDDSASTGSTT
jgi:hypothetical protein